MSRTNDQFIFVNAPTILNAGTLNARRQLRSQLMRRVYLEKHRGSPTEFEDELDILAGRAKTIGKPGLSRSPTTDPISTSRRKSDRIAVSGSLSPTELKRPILLSDAAESESRICESCGDFCADPQSCWASTRNETKAKNILRPRHSLPDADPLQAIASTMFDPFLTSNQRFRGPNADKLIHHYTKVLVPSLRGGTDWCGRVHVEYMQKLADPLLYHTVCLSASVHLSKSILLRRGIDDEERTRMLEQNYYRYYALRELRQRIARQESTIGSREFDHNIAAISMLAIHDPQSETGSRDTRIDSNPFVQSLPPLDALDVYGSEAMIEVHWKGLMALLDKHGGFDKLRLYAIKWQISYIGLKYGLHKYTKPPFPICNEKGEDLTRCTALDILGLDPSQLPPQTGDGFRHLETLQIRASNLRPFIELAQLAYGMQLLRLHHGDPTIVRLLADARNLVQYRLEQLPLLTEDSSLVLDAPIPEACDSLTQEILDSTFAVYGLCWLAIHLFTTHVTFSVATCRRFRVYVVSQFQSTMLRSRAVAHQNTYVMKLQLWALIIVGIGAEDVDTDIRLWIVLEVRKLCDRLGLRHWNEVTKVLSTFVWMNSACDHPGRRLWAEVENLT